MPTPLHSRRGAAGSSMIELLVSILIFAFGMLGMIGMQNRTLGYGQMSLLRSQAAALTDDMMDRLRTDRANAVVGNWEITLGQPASDFNGTSLAQTDRSDWLTQVAALLPSGQASVHVTTKIVTVTIQWYERGSNAANATGLTTFTTTSSL